MGMLVVRAASRTDHTQASPLTRRSRHVKTGGIEPVISVKTAQALGRTIPPPLLIRADDGMP